MYHIMSVLSLLIRQFYLPNPFECFGDIGVFSNWCAGIILAPLSYALVGLVYQRGSAPAVGSLLYLLAYSGLTAILWLLGLFSFSKWAIVGMTVIITMVIVLISKVRNTFIY